LHTVIQPFSFKAFVVVLIGAIQMSAKSMYLMISLGDQLVT